MGRKQEKFVPARVVPLHPDFGVAATTPCRFVVTIPLKLPSILASDPTNMPPPPYYHHAEKTNLHALRPKVIATLRPVLTGLLYALWGSNTAVLSLVGPNSGMKFEYDAKIVLGGNYDLQKGSWKDQYGQEGHQIDAYLDGGHEMIEVVQGFNFRIDNRLGRNGTDNPPVFQFLAADTLQGGHVVFQARTLDEPQRASFNSEIYAHEWR